MVFMQKIIQLYNITVEPIKLVRITNTLHALIVLKVMPIRWAHTSTR
jgi:hypothetical protein